MTATQARRAAGRSRTFRPAPAPSAPAGASKTSPTRFSAARTARRPARPSSSAPSISPARCSKCRPTTASASCRPPTPARSRWRCGRCSGARPVTMLAWESFGEGWVTDVVKQLKLKDVTVLKAPTASCPIWARSISPSDVVFTWNGTTSGVRVPNGDWIAPTATGPDDLRRDLGRVRAAARLAEARCRHLLLAEGARRRGRARHADPLAARGRAARKLQAGLAAAENLPHDQRRQADRRHLRRARPSTRRRCCASRTISTRSQWAKSARRVERDCCARRRRTRKALVANGLQPRRGSDFLADDPAIRSNTSVCLKVVDPAVTRLRRDAQAAFAKSVAAAAREGRRRLRHRRLSRCAAGLAHLVRLRRSSAPMSRR